MNKKNMTLLEEFEELIGIKIPVSKKFINLVLLLILGSFIVPFIVNWIFGKIINSGIGIMYVENPDVWIGFLGGFLGAGFTLIGVFWQIEHINQNAIFEKKENTKMAYSILAKDLRDLKCNLDYLLNNNLSERVREVGGEVVKIENINLLKLEITHKDFKKKEEFIRSFLKDTLTKEKNNILKLLFSFEILLENLMKSHSKSKVKVDDDLGLYVASVLRASYTEEEKNKMEEREIKSSTGEISYYLKEAIIEIKRLQEKIPKNFIE